MSLEFNAENRNANMVIRCCSFCRRSGHNILRCNSQAIRIFERSCVDFINIGRIERNEHQLQRFRNYLLNETLGNPNIVRAFAIRRCNSTTRSNMDVCIQNIMLYFTPLFNEEHTIEPHQISEPAQPAEADTVAAESPSMPFMSRLATQLIENNNLHDAMAVMLFVEMITGINQTIEMEMIQNRKFNINTKIIENNLINLHELCECNICFEDCEKKNFIKLDCKHEFCKDCIKKSLQNERRQIPCCAFCRAEIKNLELNLESIKNEFDDIIRSDV